MQALELRVPPPVVALLIAGAMWGISPAVSPSEAFKVLHMAAAAAIALLGGCISFSGILTFRRARTTVSPLRPERTSALVATGMYRFTRHPMYLGLLITLFAWSVFLLSPWSVVGPLMFGIYIDRFQIAPEERVLAAIFGSDYADYCARVRRWL